MAPPTKRYPRSTRRKEALHLVARQYTHANLQKAKAYWDDSLPPSCVAWGTQEDYEVIRQVGKGKYGEVYESTDLRSKRKCVVKIMRPVKEHRLRREIKILGHVRGGPNVVELREVLRDPDTKTPCFVFEFVDAIGFRELQGAVTDLDVRNYMYQLLRALDFCHSKGIMHRDVKPGNVLIDHNKKQLTLIDWGLADFYHPGKEYPVRVATRFYKGPELLVDIRDYDYSLDVWGVGCMLAAMVFKRPVFFRGDDEFDQLVKISRVLGSEGLHRYCEKYGIDLDPRLDQLVGMRPVVPWRKFCNAENQHLCSLEAYDLLGKLLVYDHHERLTCAEAMQHPYFAPLRVAQHAAPMAQVPVLASSGGPSGVMTSRCVGSHVQQGTSSQAEHMGTEQAQGNGVQLANWQQLVPAGLLGSNPVELGGQAVGVDGSHHSIVGGPAMVRGGRPVDSTKAVCVPVAIAIA